MRTLFTLLCGILIFGAVQAQIRHVPGAYPTIQEGINAANNGDTVLVDTGIYFEQINFLGKKPLLVTSKFLMNSDTSYISRTIIDGSGITSQDSGSIVNFINGEDTTSILCGFTIRNGTKGTRLTGTSGSAIVAGGIFIFDCGAKIIHNHVTENHISDTAASANAQLAWGGGVMTESPNDSLWVIIDHNVIDNNSALSGGLQAGAGGLAVNCNGIITNNIISNNSTYGITGASAVAGGLAHTNPPSLNLQVTATVKNNVISNNLSSSTTSWAGGGGACFEANQSIISENTVENNIANGSTHDQGGGIWINYPLEGTIVSDNLFNGNTSYSQGGGLYITPYTNPDPVTVLVENNYFTGNNSMYGGAFTSYINPVVLQNNVFSSNHANGGGGAISLGGYSTMNFDHLGVLINNSFSMNSTDLRGGAIYSASAKPLIINSIFWNDSASTQDSYEIYITPNDTAEIAFTVIDGGKIHGVWTNGGGNINEDPLFEDPDSLTITATSPCYNAGSESFTCISGETHNAPVYDIEWLQRPYGPAFDMGAHESYDNPPGIGDQNRLAGSMCHTSPNPFSSSTTFNYNLKNPCQVTLAVFNGSGQMVAMPVNTYQQKGDHQVVWSSEGLPAGMYYYRIEVGGIVGTGKMIKQ